MEPTILEAISIFIGTSAASGITWDLINKAGKGFLDSFEKRFFRYFKDKLDAVNYLQDIAKKESYNKAEPLKDAEAMYNSRTGQQDSQEFINDLTNWLKENKEQFSDLAKQNVKIIAETINAPVITATNVGNVTTTNNNNNYGNANSPSQDEKKNSYPFHLQKLIKTSFYLVIHKWLNSRQRLQLVKTLLLLVGLVE